MSLQMPPQGPPPPLPQPPPPPPPPTLQSQTSTVSIPPALSLPSTSTAKQTTTFGHDRQPSVQLKIEASGGPPLLSKVCLYIFQVLCSTNTVVTLSGIIRRTRPAALEALFRRSFRHPVPSLTRSAIDLSAVDTNLPGAIQRRRSGRFLCADTGRIHLTGTVVPHDHLPVVARLSRNANILAHCRPFDSLFLQQSH